MELKDGYGFCDTWSNYDRVGFYCSSSLQEHQLLHGSCKVPQSSLKPAQLAAFAFSHRSPICAGKTLQSAEKALREEHHDPAPSSFPLAMASHSRNRGPNRPPSRDPTDAGDPPHQHSVRSTSQHDAAPPNAVGRDAIASLVQQSPSLPDGKLAHALIVTIGLEQDTFLANLIVSMYGRYGLVAEARAVFNAMHRRTIVSWSAMISIYTQHGLPEEALSLYGSMLQEGGKPNQITLVNVVSACASLSVLEHGRQIHTQIVEDGFALDVVLGTALLTMYSKCCDLSASYSVFNQMPLHDTVSWNAMIAAYEQGGHNSEAIDLFEAMQKEDVEPSSSTYVSMLTACANTAALEKGQFVHICITKDGLDSEVMVCNALIHMYGKCQRREEARTVFDDMQKRDVVTWNSIIAVYAQEGWHEKVLELFKQMLQGGLKPSNVTFINALSACSSPEALQTGKTLHEHIAKGRSDTNVLVGTALVDMYGKCGDPEAAHRVFNKIKSSDAICWNAMISAYAQQGHSLQALSLFDNMQKSKLCPTKSTYVSALTACADLAALPEGHLIHVCILDDEFESEVVIVNALIHMYGKCGRLDEARALFDRLNHRELVSWNAMITAYAQQGHGKEVVDFYEKMQQEGVRPSEVTFISLLSACSHAGLVEEGHRYFISMTNDFGITAFNEHYACLIDLYGRAGRLKEAETLIYKMPIEPTAPVWSAFLSSCRMHGDVKRAKIAAQKLFVLEPKDGGAYVTLTNIYIAEGKQEDTKSLQRFMVQRSVKESGGYS